MQSQSLTRITPQLPATLAETQNLSEIFCKSGFFADAKQAAQAMVKIMAGAEIGFPPIAAMTGVYIVKGKVSLSANLMAAAIKRSGKYNFKIRTHSADECKLEFFEMAESVGFSEFTIKEAHAANLHRDWDRERGEWKEKPTWKGFPKNMLFARALSNGAKWFCADIFGGPVYTPDELGATVDGETGEVIDIEAEPVEAPKGKTPRAALKAAPVIEVEPEPVADQPASDEDIRELATVLLETAKAAIRAEDDPLPEFAEREQEETPEEIEADRQNIIAALKLITLQFRTEAEFDQWMADSDAGNQTRGWLRTMLQKAQAKALKVAEATAPVVLTEKQSKEAPGQTPDGKRKQLRKGEDGSTVAVYEGSHMAGKVMTGEQSLAALNQWVEFWRTHPSQGQDLATVHAKVEKVTGPFINFADLNAADTAKAIRTLQEWRPDLDEQAAQARAQKGAKK